MLGKPVIAGTRITVEFILEQLAAGETIDQIMDGYELAREEAQAAMISALPLPQRLRQLPQEQFGIRHETSGLGRAPVGQFGDDRRVDVYDNGFHGGG